MPRYWPRLNIESSRKLTGYKHDVAGVIHSVPFSEHIPVRIPGFGTGSFILSLNMLTLPGSGEKCNFSGGGQKCLEVIRVTQEE